MFIFGTCASKYSQILCNFFESFLVFNFVDNSTSNFITFLNNTTNNSSKIFGLHHSVIFLLFIMSKDSSFYSNRFGGLDMITTNHSDGQIAHITSIRDTTLNIWSNWISESECTNEFKWNLSIAQLLFKFLTSGGTSLSFKSVDPLIALHFKGGKSNNSKHLSSHLSNFLVDLFFFVLS